MNSLYLTGGVAGMLAGIVFRRNLGVEVALFSAQNPPDAIGDWFALLQSNRLLGLTYLHIFDVVNYVLVGVMLLALYVALKPLKPSAMAVAALLGFWGMAVYFATNTALSLLALSGQYAAATDKAEQGLLLAAGQALLALNRFTMDAQPGSGGYVSLLLVAAAGLIASLVMWRSPLFGRAAATVGVAANTLDLAYCLTYLAAPASAGLLAILFIPAAGLFFMIWHVVLGWKLVKLAVVESRTPVTYKPLR